MTAEDIIKKLEEAEGAPADPMALFGQWLAEAEGKEPRDANAMCLATVDEDGRPSARIMLLKGYDEQGFVFYTNKESRKGEALEANPVAALSFYWKSLGRQVRVEGRVEHISDEEADSYFASRPAGSRIGAWASQQSRKLASRSMLRAAVEKFEAQYKGGENIPRPPHWGGYRVIPDHIEFWHEGEYRLHTRIIYERHEGEDWDKEMLFP